MSTLQSILKAVECLLAVWVVSLPTFIQCRDYRAQERHVAILRDVHASPARDVDGEDQSLLDPAQSGELLVVFACERFLGCVGQFDADRTEVVNKHGIIKFQRCHSFI